MKRIAFFIPFQGCTRRCVYCNQSAITGVGVPPAPGEAASAAAREASPVELCFFGGSFARLGAPLMEAYLAAVLRAPRGSVVTFSSYPGDFTGERGARVLDVLEKYPIGTIELGVPSLDEGVLARCGREGDAAEVTGVARALAGRGYRLGAQIMTGLPGQTPESSAKDIRTLGAVMRDFRAAWDLRIYPCLVLRGSELEAMRGRGEYVPLTVEEAARQCGRLLITAEEEGFRVIRVGLTDSASLRESVIGGPYHASFGELAMSEKTVLLMAEESRLGPWRADARNISLLTGHGRRGIKRLAELTGMSESDVRGKISLVNARECGQRTNLDVIP
jgi:histone acetyltransferase (RNA polymerase elongator complex component)